jgi:hypothetical protein
MINEHRKTRISLIDERVTQKNAGARQGCYKVGSVNYYLLRLIKVTLICNAIYKTSRQCSHEEWVTLVVKKLIFLTVALLCIMGTVKTRSMLFACKYHEYNPSLVNKFTSGRDWTLILYMLLGSTFNLLHLLDIPWLLLARIHCCYLVHCQK